MARKRKKEFILTYKKILILLASLVIIALTIIVVNRTIPSTPDYKISFNLREDEMYIGDTRKFDYYILNATGNDKLIWATSDSRIASVDANGKVNAKSFGDVKITVSLVNGNSATLKLHIKSYPVSLKLNIDQTASHDWFNKPVNVEIESFNIKNIKYCVSASEKCNPNIVYKGKITLKNGMWYLNISGIDRNLQEFDYHELFKVDLIAPVCNITRLGKLEEETATIMVNCVKDISGIYSYEWYRDGKRIYVTNKDQINTKEIYEEGKHKYSVKVYDLAGNYSEISVN